MTSHVARRFVAAVLLLGLLGAPVIYFAIWAWQPAACRMLDRAGAFPAYCDTPAFGSYEHEAYWFDLEAEAVRAM